MASLTVWKFGTAEGAGEALSTLQSLQQQRLITVLDAAIVEWPADKKKPKTRQLHNLAGAGAMGGAFWGMLFGLLFFVPLLGMAMGAAVGALTGALSDVGIDNRFMEDVKAKVTPGTSALFLMSADAVTDRIRDSFKGQNIELIASNLSKDQEQKLNEVFAEE